jgi:hypothetical protein
MRRPGLPIRESVTNLAICTPAAGSERTAGILIPLAGALLYVLLMRIALREGDPQLRPRLLMLWVVTGVIGGIVGVTPGGVSDPDGDYLARFFNGMLIALAVSVVWTLATARRELWRFVLIGLLGGATFIPWLLGLFFFSLSASGSCIG